MLALLAIYVLLCGIVGCGPKYTEPQLLKMVETLQRNDAKQDTIIQEQDQMILELRNELDELRGEY